MGVPHAFTMMIIFLDIKGANILVNVDGMIKLADFGASKQLADIVSYAGGCKSVAGTPYWMVGPNNNCYRVAMNT